MIGKLALIMGMITTQRQQSKAFGEEFIIASPCSESRSCTLAIWPYIFNIIP
jgi:hypothetical protein